MKLKIAHILMAVSMFISAIVLVYVDSHDMIHVDTQQSLITAWGIVIFLPLLALYFYYSSFRSVRTKDTKSKLINYVVCVLLFLAVTLVKGFEITLFDNVLTAYAGMIISVIAVILACMVKTKKISK